MNLRYLFTSLAIASSLTVTAASAQEAVWQASYQLETAGKYYDAIAALDPVPVNGPDAELRLLRRAWLYYLSARYDESIREYRMAIDKNGKSIDARLGVTLPLLAQKKWREVILNAKSVLEVAPNNYTALLRIVTAEEALGEWQELARYAAMMVAHYPTDATSYVYLARAYAWLNKRTEAVTAYAAVLVRVPGHLEAKAYIDKKP